MRYVFAILVGYLALMHWAGNASAEPRFETPIGKLGVVRTLECRIGHPCWDAPVILGQWQFGPTGSAAQK